MQDFTIEVDSDGSIIEKWIGFQYRGQWKVRSIDLRPARYWNEILGLGIDYKIRNFIIHNHNPSISKQFISNLVGTDIVYEKIMNTLPIYLYVINGFFRRLHEIPSLSELALEKIDTFETTWFENMFSDVYDRLMKPKFNKQPLTLIFDDKTQKLLVSKNISGIKGNYFIKTNTQK
jgi:hypothetical protein